MYSALHQRFVGLLTLCATDLQCLPPSTYSFMRHTVFGNCSDVTHFKDDVIASSTIMPDTSSNEMTVKLTST